MIFRPELAQLVLSGEKTETRRVINGEKPCRYEPFRSYAVQPGRGKKAVGRIRIREVRREVLGEIDDTSAKREGFAGRDAFVDYWRSLHGNVDLETPVWAVAFSLVVKKENQQ